ncbi:MAG TPA: hypothetical protein VFO65_03875 [Acidimicrobiales bacterium]|nr:hypothetical protein [Acidimicrobiales bacterium]
MRVAFVGKGGAGKSAIAGTFCRALARHGRPVLALDSDPMPGLAFSIGLGSSDDAIPDDALEEKAQGEEGPRFRLRAGLSAHEAVDLYARQAPDGVRFLQFGKLRGHSANMMRAQIAFRQIVADLPEDRWDIVGDLPGGPRQAAFGWAPYADTYLVVVEPTSKSLLSARRIARVAAKMEGTHRVVAVANRVREAGDEERVREATGLDVIGAVPWDEELAEAERRSLAPIDHAPGSKAVRAVESLVDRLAGETDG